MLITGFTDSRLNEVSTYSKTSKYQIGYKGVTNVLYDDENKPTLVEYIINGINYKTSIGKPLFPDTDLFFQTETVYYFEANGLTQKEVNLIKNEVEIGVSEKPKIESDIFIERQSTSVFERHLRLGDIGSLDQLETYKNGYYNIF